MRLVRRSTSFATLLLLTAAVSARAATLDLASGTAGTLNPFQSFNETRLVRVFVQGSAPLSLTSMTLRGLNVGSETGTVGARVYDSGGLRIAAADVEVPTADGQTVAVPIAASLSGGHDYYLGFFVSAGGNQGSATLFDPAPPAAGGFPDDEPAHVLRIDGTYSGPNDDFNVFTSTMLPLVSAEFSNLLDAPRPAPGDGWAIASVRPNPLKYAGVVELTVPIRARVVFEQLSVAGQSLRRLERTIEPGSHSIPVRAGDLPAGVYFLRVSGYADTGALSYRTTRRFVVLGR